MPLGLGVSGPLRGFPQTSMETPRRFRGGPFKRWKHLGIALSALGALRGESYLHAAEVKRLIT